GLSRQLSPSRSNGLNAVLQRMRELAGQTAG
ncbi:SufE family protein, partial [Klebsiella pneumoniae]|nr:SufE family protein [Klebsiella pneumoniae]